MFQTVQTQVIQVIQAIMEIRATPTSLMILAVSTILMIRAMKIIRCRDALVPTTRRSVQMEPAFLRAIFAAEVVLPAHLEAFVTERSVCGRILRLLPRGALVPTTRRSVQMEPAFLRAIFAAVVALPAHLEAFVTELLSALNLVLPLQPRYQQWRALLPHRNRVMEAAFRMVPFAV